MVGPILFGAILVVLTLRPNWLTPRGPTSMQAGSNNAVTAYVDGQRLGTVEALRSISSMEVASVRRYDAVTAQQRFGLGNFNGVVEVITRRGGR